MVVGSLCIYLFSLPKSLFNLWTIYCLIKTVFYFMSLFLPSEEILLYISILICLCIYFLERDFASRRHVVSTLLKYVLSLPPIYFNNYCNIM